MAVQTTEKQSLDELHLRPSYLNRRITGPKVLGDSFTGEDYRDFEKLMDEKGILAPNDADKTKINIAGVQRKWDRYVFLQRIKY